MRLPMKPWQTPATTASLPSLLREREHGRQRLGSEAESVRTTSSSPHDLRRAEEVHAEHASRVPPPGHGIGQMVDVEIGGVRGDDRALVACRVEGLEHLLLEGHLLEHRLDDEVGAGRPPSIVSMGSISAMRASASRPRRCVRVRRGSRNRSGWPRARAPGRCRRSPSAAPGYRRWRSRSRCRCPWCRRR